jgi:hypothetical protein
MRKGKRTFASRKRKIAGLCAFVLAGLMGLGAYAFTASNTVPAQAAGGGAAAVSGYTETGASFTWSLNGEYITKGEVYLENVSEIKPSDVAVSLGNGATPTAEEWVDCPEGPGGGEYKEISKTKWEVECVFKAGTGAHKTATEFETYKYTANGVPNANGNELTLSAVSQGVAIVE